MAERGDQIDESKIISADVVERWHRALLANKSHMQLIEQRKGITEDTIKRRRIGHNGERFTIPIPIADGTIVNVRMWSPTDRERKVINAAGHGERRLYPLDALEFQTIVITEGELKALLLWQQGFKGVTTTAGAGTWVDAWNEMFKDKDVIIIQDIDKAGREGATAKCYALATKARSIKNVLLPLDAVEYPTGGVDDYFLRMNATTEDLWKVINDTPPWRPTPLVVRSDDDKTVYPETLGRSSEARHFNKFVSVDCVVSAKDTHPYIVPRKFTVSCLKDQDYCAACPIWSNPSERPEVAIDEKNAVLLELVNIKQHFQRDALKKAASIPPQCRSCSFNVLTTHNVEELRLIPQLKVSTTHDNDHVVRRAFFVGHGIDTNVSYNVEARSVPEPNTQYATLLIYNAKAAVDSLSTFKITPEMQELLKMFQPVLVNGDVTVESCEERLNDIYTDLERNVTHIYKRRDMHLLYDLVYHSVLYVPFQGRPYKGWVEGLVIGDSGQGKSETISRLIGHYRLGEKVDVKNASIAGLLGGLQETGKRWFISWGVITLNDRRMVTLEEVKGLDTAVIAKMTDARSSGIIELSKIEKAKTTCRCRLAWVSNPRSDRPLRTYNYGIEAVKELIGSLEDVRRFDLACVVASGDVPKEIINLREADLVAVSHKYTSEACRQLITWAWSRKLEQVIYPQETIDATLEAAKEMSAKYSSAIPLVEAADQRLKIARLSCSVAARLFSTDDGERLLVRPAHVRVVTRFLDRLYSDPNLGYLEYSKQVTGEVVLEEEEPVRNRLLALPHVDDIVRTLLEANLLGASDIMDAAGIDFEEAKDVIGLLVRKRALKRYRTTYVKTPAFIALLKQMRATGPHEKPPPPHIEKPKPPSEF